MNAGKAFKERREARGMTLEEAASILRISRKFIENIEEGDYRKWPARVFSYGYIRSYANLLSMDPEPVLCEYAIYISKNDVEVPAAGYPMPTWVEKERRRGSRRVTYAKAVAVVLLVGLFLAWLNARMASHRVPASPQVAVAPPAPKQMDNAASGATEAGADNSAHQAPPAGPALPVVSPPVPVEPAPSVAAVSGQAKSPCHLFLEASEMTWLIYRVDEDEPVDITLFPRDRISVKARNKIFLKLGNAGGVVGTFNGKKLPAFGARGEVKEIKLEE